MQRKYFYQSIIRILKMGFKLSQFFASLQPTGKGLVDKNNYG